ncbi:LysE family translocator [Rhodococcus sp. NPDC003382]
MAAAFVAAVAFMVMTPGPDSLAVAAAALRSRADAVATALGALTGMLVFTVAACAGLAALLVAAPAALAALRIIGGIYLIFIGLTSLRSAVRVPDSGEDEIWDSAESRRGVLAPTRRFRRGFLIDTTNPKTLVVFVTVIPAFAGPDADYRTLVGHCLFLVAFAAAWLLTVALFAAEIGRLGPRLARWIAIIMSGVMCGFGLAILVFDPFVRG